MKFLKTGKGKLTILCTLAIAMIIALMAVRKIPRPDAQIDHEKIQPQPVFSDCNCNSIKKNHETDAVLNKKDKAITVPKKVIQNQRNRILIGKASRTYPSPENGKWITEKPRLLLEKGSWMEGYVFHGTNKIIEVIEFLPEDARVSDDFYHECEGEDGEDNGKQIKKNMVVRLYNFESIWGIPDGKLYYASICITSIRAFICNNKGINKGITEFKDEESYEDGFITFTPVNSEDIQAFEAQLEINYEFSGMGESCHDDFEYDTDADTENENVGSGKSKYVEIDECPTWTYISEEKLQAFLNPATTQPR